MKFHKYLVKLIDLYQKFLSPAYTCVFFPSCSEYTKQAINKYGAVRGTIMGLRRILRCHPWQKNHYDPLA